MFKLFDVQNVLKMNTDDIQNYLNFETKKL